MADSGTISTAEFLGSKASPVVSTDEFLGKSGTAAPQAPVVSTADFLGQPAKAEPEAAEKIPDPGVAGPARGVAADLSGQGVVSAMGSGAAQSAISGVGRAVQGAAVTARVGARQLSETQQKAIERVDQGLPVTANDDPAGYEAMSQEQRQAFKAELAEPVAPIEQTGLYRAGKSIEDFGAEHFPVSDENAKKFGVKVASGLGGIAPYVAVGYAGGIPAMVIASFFDGAEEERRKAVDAGATQEQEDAAVMHAAAVNAGANAVPVWRFMKPMTRDLGLAEWGKAVLRKAGEDGVVFSTIGQAQSFITNAIEKYQYAPDREALAGNSLEGAAEQFVTGMVMGGGSAASVPPIKRIHFQPEGPRTPEEKAAFDAWLRERNAENATYTEVGTPERGLPAPKGGEGSAEAAPGEPPPPPPGGGTPAADRLQAYIEATSSDYPKTPGVREAAAVTPAELSAEDHASPIDNEHIAGGKKIHDDAEAQAQANEILTQNDAPPVGTAVAIRHPDGIVEHGTVTDAFAEGRTAGLIVSFGNGDRFKATFPELAETGTQIEPLGPNSPPATLDTAAAQGPGVTESAPGPNAAASPPAKAEAPTARDQEPAPKPAGESQVGQRGRTTSALSGSTIFTTAKGSTYQVHDDGTTTRNKAFRPEHGEAEQGPQPRSETTYYVTPEQAAQLSLIQAQGGPGEKVLSSLGDNRIGVLWTGGPSSGKFERSTVVTPETTPTVGLLPVEIWDAGRRVHFGNEITEVRSGTARANSAPQGDGTRASPITVRTPEDLKAAEALVNTKPTEGQAEAGNYQKAHFLYQDFNVSIENPKGSERSGTAPDGTKWTATLPADYGYIKRTEGADGDQFDVYLGPNPGAPKVFVVDQIDPKTGKFDEHKGLLGFDTMAQAISTYDEGFSDSSGPSRRGSITEMSVDQFRQYIKGGDLAGALTYKSTEPVPPPSKQDALKAKIAAKRGAKPTFVDQMENYYQPGSDHAAYGGTKDRVVSFGREGIGGWTVKVREIGKDGKLGPERSHSTPPSRKDLVAWEANNPIGTKVIAKRQPIDKNRMSLVELIAAEGGINDQAETFRGEMAARDLHKFAPFVPAMGRRSLVRSGGMDLDNAAELAEQYGHIPERDVSKLLEAIEQDARAIREKRKDQRVYAAGDKDGQAVIEAARQAREHDAALYHEREALETEAEQLGIDHAKHSDNDGLRQAIEARAEEVDQAEREAMAAADDVAKEIRADEQGPEFDVPYGESPRPRPEAAADQGEARPQGEARDTGEARPGNRDERGAGEEVRQTDRTEAGEQRVIPGAERITDKELAERKGGKPLRSDRQQKPAGDTPLFDTGAHGQRDLLDAAKPAETNGTAAVRSEAVKASPAILKDLHARLTKLGLADKVALRVVDHINNVFQSGKQAPAFGAYESAKKLITVSLEGDGQHWVLNHEIIHVLRDLGLIKDAEWTTLVKRAEAEPGLRAQVEKDYAGLGLKDEQIQEEMVANHFGNEKAQEEARGFIRQAWERIKAVLRAIRDAFRANGIRTAEDIFRDIESGDIGRREPTGEATDKTPLSISAYHGSPHDFDAFSTSRIGTGEGHQAFGHGLYFASKKALAEHYRRALAGEEKPVRISIDGDEGNWESLSPDERAAAYELHPRLTPYQGITTAADAAKIVARTAEDLRYTIKNTEKAHSEGRPMDSRLPIDYERDNLPAIKAALKMIEDGRVKLLPRERPGKLYHVELAPEEHELLDWDKSLGQQSDHVKAALEKMGVNVAERGTPKQLYESARRYFDSAQMQRDAREDIGIRQNLAAAYKAFQKGPEAYASYIRGADDGYVKSRLLGAYKTDASQTAGNFYERLAIDKNNDTRTYRQNKVAATEALREAGIRGIKYLDQGSRTAGEGTHNYVIFDDKDVSIQAKYAIRAEATRAQQALIETAGRRKDLGKFLDESGPAMRNAFGSLHQEITDLAREMDKGQGVAGTLKAAMDRHVELPGEFKVATRIGDAETVSVKANALIDRLRAAGVSLPDAVKALSPGGHAAIMPSGKRGIDVLRAIQETTARIESERHGPQGQAVGRAALEGSRDGGADQALGPPKRPLYALRNSVDPTDPVAKRNPIAQLIRGGPARFGDNGAGSLDGLATSIVRDVQMKVVPMLTGSIASRSAAKDFANYLRWVRFRYSQIDEMLKADHQPDRRATMGAALDEQSVHEQGVRDALAQTPEDQREALGERMTTAFAGKGLDRLSPDERRSVEVLDNLAKDVWQRMYEVGIVTAEHGLPSYMPRMFVNLAEDGTFGRLPGQGHGGAGQNLDPLGLNLTTQGPMERELLTPEETEAAVKAKFGPSATLVTDIRALPLALSRAERAIAGKNLVNTIRELSAQAGSDLVSDHATEENFTLDHPALKEWRPAFRETEDGNFEAVKDENGDVVMRQYPIYIHRDFEGPLRAVLTGKSGAFYNALMQIKQRAMLGIMYSPMIHNQVEWGRALEAAPGSVSTFSVYFRGNKVKGDPAATREAIADGGLVPVGARGGYQDITGIAQDPEMKPGRGYLARGLAYPLEKAGADRAGEAVRRAIDKAGDWWHGALLWDRVADLQWGLYDHFLHEKLAEGWERQDAVRFAAHQANRFAGSLPAESMSQAAQKFMNVALFSKTFTLGNIGVTKDALLGLPRDVAAQIERDSGKIAAKAADSATRLLAIRSMMLGTAIAWGLESILQNYLQGDNSTGWGDVAKSYGDRLRGRPTEPGNPALAMARPFRPSTWNNEPGKEDRVLVGHDDRGTGIYMRLPAGKVSEDSRHWFTDPVGTLWNKMSTLVKPLVEVGVNKDFAGHRIAKWDDASPLGIAKAVGNVAAHLMEAQLPWSAIVAAKRLIMGEDTTADTLRGDVSTVVGPLIGTTFSHGYRGGPEIGAMHHAEKRVADDKADAMPEINQMILRGNIEGAREAMTALGMRGQDQIKHIRNTLNPQGTVTPGRRAKFNRIGTDDEKAKASP